MAENPQKPKPLNRTVYPFPRQDASTSADATPVEPGAQDYFEALSEAEDGFFPIGYNGQWHGGIHFGAETGRLLEQEDGVRCIADGEVIAYRIDADYPTVPYQTCAAAKYSSGFVLVRHRLQPPPAPQADTQEPDAVPEDEQSDTEQSLVLYSLYMHLSNWPSYDTNQELARPAFWSDAVHLVGDRAMDSDREANRFIPATGGIGMNLRDAGNAIAGFAPRGVKLKLGEANSARPAYYQILEVVGGTTYPGDVTGLYIYKGTATSREGLTSTSQPHVVGAVHVLPEPAEIKPGDLIGHLGQYQRYLDMDPMVGCTDRPLAQIDVFTPEDLHAFIQHSRARDSRLDENAKTLLHVKPGAMLVQPAEPDIELNGAEAAVVQGEGSTGSGWVKGRRGTIEIVSDRPPGFVTATRTYADGRIFLAAVDASGNELTLEAFNALTDKSAYTRRKLLTPSGSDIWLDHSAATPGSVVNGPARAWSRFPLQVANAAGEAVAHSNVVSLKSASSSTAEEDGTRWFLIDAGTAAGDPIQGWARESDHPNVERCSPWAWPGFELFDTGELQPRELFARELSSSRRSTPSEQDAFEASARSVEDSPLFAALGQAIDTDDNKQITPLELRDALKKPWLAQAISRLVIRYPSEWAPPMDRWDQVDSLIEDPALLVDWQHEKRRIESLHIWPHVAGGHGPSSSTVHHLHPIGFVENFAGKRGLVTVEMLKKIFTSAPDDRLRLVADGVNLNLDDGKLDSELRLTHFFAQVRQEVGNSMVFRENLRYSADQLFASRLSYYRGNRERSDRDALNEEAIANNAYDDANRGQGFKLGNTQPGDGWRYRGRGLKQLTGRSNYQSFTRAHQRIWGERIDFELSPDKVGEPTYAVRSGLWFWVENRLYLHADNGINREATDRITTGINAGTDSHADRWSHAQSIWTERVFKDVF